MGTTYKLSAKIRKGKERNKIRTKGGGEQTTKVGNINYTLIKPGVVRAVFGQDSTTLKKQGGKWVIDYNKRKASVEGRQFAANALANLPAQWQ